MTPGLGLGAFFKARSVVVVGASDDFTKIGGRPIQLMLKYCYAGEIYPINPKGGIIQGLQAYTSVRDTPTAPELAILAVPVQATVQGQRLKPQPVTPQDDGVYQHIGLHG